ncbi:MAG: hypothetical protein ACP5PT_09105, partial [Brevinematia bacterium]
MPIYKIYKKYDENEIKVIRILINRKLRIIFNIVQGHVRLYTLKAFKQFIKLHDFHILVVKGSL